MYLLHNIVFNIKFKVADDGSKHAKQLLVDIVNPCRQSCLQTGLHVDRITPCRESYFLQMELFVIRAVELIAISRWIYLSIGLLVDSYLQIGLLLVDRTTCRSACSIAFYSCYLQLHSQTMIFLAATPSPVFKFKSFQKLPRLFYLYLNFFYSILYCKYCHCTEVQ